MITRKLFSSLLLTALFAAIVASPVSAAPAAVPLANEDAGAVSATNGDTTLVAWTNVVGLHTGDYRVFIRVLDSPFDRNAILLASGYAPHIATNGQQYVVGYSIGGSRFLNLPYDNVAIQRVSPEGVAFGPRRILSHSITGNMDSVAWNGTHWIAAYRSFVGLTMLSYVAFLDESLDVVAKLELGAGPPVVALEEIGGRWWAVRADLTAVEAIELHRDGTTGARFATASLGGSNPEFTRGDARLLLAQNGDDIEAVPFDPVTGFGAHRTLLEATHLLDVEAFDGGSLLLISAPFGTRYDTIFVNAAGELGPPLPLLETPLHWNFFHALGRSNDGVLLFVSPRVGTAPGTVPHLYAFRVGSRAQLDPASAQLVSQVTVTDRRRAARH